MGYGLGVDLGTTHTAAAVNVDGRVEAVRLGSRRPEIPSVIFLRPDGSLLVGEAALRRGEGDPGRLAREFKRRLGDPVPIIVGGAPLSAHALTARLLHHVVDTVTRVQESAPDHVVVTHPANWGPYKRELLTQAVQLADVGGATLQPEPKAAAVRYAGTARVSPGEIVAVYDLGGGTFDAAVLRKLPDGFALLGETEGIEQLGGIDFDEAVFEHVRTALGGALAGLDPGDDAATEALARLRRDCVEAKETLSYDTEAMIAVALPRLHTHVRINRAEFEAMIAPALDDTVAAMRRALHSAGVSPDQLRGIVLAGGSARIPLVGQLLSAAFDRPISPDEQPELGIALGAAQLSAPTTAPAAPPPRSVFAAGPGSGRAPKIDAASGAGAASGLGAASGIGAPSGIGAASGIGAVSGISAASGIGTASELGPASGLGAASGLGTAAGRATAAPTPGPRRPATASARVAPPTVSSAGPSVTAPAAAPADLASPPNPPVAPSPSGNRPAAPPAGKSPAGKSAPGRTPPGETPPGKTPPGKRPPGKASVEVPVGQAGVATVEPAPEPRGAANIRTRWRPYGWPLIGGVVGVILAVTAATAWPRSGTGTPHDQNSATAVVPVANLLWRAPTGRNATDPPAVTADRIVVGGADGVIRAFRRSDGHPDWTLAAGPGVNVGTAVVDGVVYATTTDGDVLAVNATSGKELWRKKTHTEIDAPPAVGNGLVYAGGRDFVLYAYRTGGTHRRWRVFTDGEIRTSPTVHGKVAIVAGRDGVLTGADETGRRLWRTRVGQVTGEANAAGDAACVPIDDGSLRCVRVSDGAVLSRMTQPGTALSSPVGGDGGIVYAAAADRTVGAWDVRTGKPRWRFRPAGGAPAGGRLALRDGQVDIVYPDGRLAGVDATTGAPRWEFTVDDRLDTAPGGDQAALVLLGRTGSLYALQPPRSPAGHAATLSPTPSPTPPAVVPGTTAKPTIATSRPVTPAQGPRTRTSRAKPHHTATHPAPPPTSSSTETTGPTAPPSTTTPPTTDPTGPAPT
jgi:outer membrane protein assembly factor BamB/actin-like ATPase involved in cell morphogenesis